MGKNYTILSNQAINYLCGVLRDSTNVADGISDLAAATDSTFSSYKISQLLTTLETNVKSYSDDLVSHLTHLELELGATTADVTKENVIYLIPDGVTANAYDQYLLINGAPLNIGGTQIDLTQYLTKTAADAAYASATDMATVKTTIGTATLATTDKTLKGAINEIGNRSLLENSTAFRSGLSGGTYPFFDVMNGDKMDRIYIDKTSKVIGAQVWDSGVYQSGFVVPHLDDANVSTNGTYSSRFLDFKSTICEKELTVPTDIIAYIDARAPEITTNKSVTEVYRCMNSLTSPYANSDNDFHYEVNYVYGDTDAKWIRVIAKDVRSGQIFSNAKVNGYWLGWESIYGSNPNLLDNGWFTVNQRNATQVSTGGDFIADRWQIVFNPESNVLHRDANNCLYIENQPVSDNVYMWQVLEDDNASRMVHQQLTGSVLLEDGTIYSGKAIFPAMGESDAWVINNTDVLLYYQYGTNSQNRPVVGVAFRNKNMKIRAIKIEFGTVSTLCKDTLPKYKDELTKCQRFYRKIVYGQYEVIGPVSNNSASIVVDIGAGDMANALPTLTLSDKINVQGMEQTPTEIDGFTSCNIKNGRITLQKHAQTFTTQYSIAYAKIGGCTIELSCDL